MSRKTVKSCDEILSAIENMMDTVDVARLTQSQYAEVKRLQKALKNSCATNDLEQAVRTEDRIVAIIKEGPPFHQ